MRYAVIFSTKDTASMNILDKLLKGYNFVTSGKFDGHDSYCKDGIRLYVTDRESIYCEDIDDEVKEEVIVFATKHESQNGTPSLSVHAPGNWGEAKFGGRDNELCVAPAKLLMNGLWNLEKRNTGFEIIQECTHHGPFLKKPVMFIEIGSKEEQWENPEAGRIVADALMDTLYYQEEPKSVVVGVGGLHHCPNFKKLTDVGIAVGHVCPKYMLYELTKEKVQQAIDRTLENVEVVALDWKGLGSEKQRILEENMNVKKIKEIISSYQHQQVR